MRAPLLQSSRHLLVALVALFGTVTSPNSGAAQAAMQHDLTGAAANWRPLIGTAGNLAELCTHAAGAPWANAPGAERISCWLSDPVRRGFRSLALRFAHNLRLYLLSGDGPRWRVVGLLENAEGNDDQHSDAWLLSADTLRTSEGRRVFYFESRSETVERNESRMAVLKRRTLTVCVESQAALRCSFQAPLRRESWNSPARPERGRRPPVADEQLSRAAARVRRDGTVRLRLRQGTWRELHGSDAFTPGIDAYPEERRTCILRYEGTGEP